MSRREWPRPELVVGDRVTIETDAGSWEGTVTALKTSLESGWWVEVRGANGLTWTVPAAMARRDRR